MINLSYNGYEINQRESDGYVNATQMCKVVGKKVNDWTRTKETKAYINGVAVVTEIPATELIVSIQGGDPSSQGTWIHPKLAICLGRWISVDFALWCDQHIRQLIETGSTSTPQQKTPQPAPLPVRDTIDYIEAANKLEGLRDSMLKTLLADSLVDELSLRRNSSVALLPRKDYTIAKVRAKMLGYTEKEIGNGSQLGAFIRKRIEPAFQEMIGRYPVYHYEITPELDTVIHTFFGAK